MTDQSTFFIIYFLISREKFNFVQFLEKNELVSKNAVFFFPVPEKKTAFKFELVSAYRTFPGKKNKAKKKQILEKKKTPPKTTFSKIWEIDSMDYGKILTKVS